ncbi:ABC transporter substrate-binding protein [Bradyrhizobium elkanii]|uniref:ABC transporter substrate-binding protein n=1 Tax=Bradyrhizobium elkanii TaxID=29448 RepID=UPI00209E3612|nr:ABC transporter substrate-binding protein [Bradyrhizobium elkanii]MCP1974744.1 branched-chain amino acid transport system substrate-binding protein [Bradyrhizobium elkanii]MCS3521824.1 branched-chain amino acid transport system substrate-binding protein [Bradyrhizobium elkanii]MCS4069479.1 branched-chain amino acid transport system substrate-binding protein [Bradyrhizobium elkanii]MCS4076109.1 branched-chain amino acid transport system substrate-binding protein [Bradyrhizobium elkanii]MCS41
MISRYGWVAASAAILSVAFAAPSHAQISDDAVKIGVLTDQAGLYADAAGPGAVEAVRMAIADFGGKVLGKPIAMVDADHQNKADIGAGIARRWYEQENVDVIVDFANSAVAFAVLELTKQKNKAMLVSSAGSSDLTGKGCSANSVQWTYNTYALANSTVRALAKSGAKSWYFVTVDYAFGHALRNDAARTVEKVGGSIAGEVRHPLNSMDFSSYLLQAQSSNADVIAFANTGGDLANSIRQAQEFGMAHTQKLAAFLMQTSDIHAIGLQAAQGLQLATAFYWDLDDKTRDFAARFMARTKKRPTMVQAGLYSAVMNYLKAVEKSGTDDGPRVIAQMKDMPIDDFFARNAFLREDGQLIHDMYLVQVKSPAESKGAWDYEKLVQVIPGKEAFATPEESACPLLKK